MKSAQKTVALWFFLVLVAVFIFQAYESRHQVMIADFNYSKFSEAIKANEVASVSFRPESSEIAGDMKPDFEKKERKPGGPPQQPGSGRQQFVDRTPPKPGGGMGNPFGGDWFSQGQGKKR